MEIPHNVYFSKLRWSEKKKATSEMPFCAPTFEKTKVLTSLEPGRKQIIIHRAYAHPNPNPKLKSSQPVNWRSVELSCALFILFFWKSILHDEHVCRSEQLQNRFFMLRAMNTALKDSPRRIMFLVCIAYIPASAKNYGLPLFECVSFKMFSLATAATGILSLIYGMHSQVWSL